MRFCSRCGFPLEIVSELVRSGGALAGYDPEAKKKRSPRQKGVRRGVILIIISALLVPIAAGMTAIEEEFFVLFFPVFLLFVLGLAGLLHAYLMAPKAPPENERLFAGKTRQLPHVQASALPAGYNNPVAPWRQPVNTSEMAQPASVVDHTTKLFKDETAGR